MKPGCTAASKDNKHGKTWADISDSRPQHLLLSQSPATRRAAYQVWSIRQTDTEALSSRPSGGQASESVFNSSRSHPDKTLALAHAADVNVNVEGGRLTASSIPRLGKSLASHTPYVADTGGSSGHKTGSHRMSFRRSWSGNPPPPSCQTSEGPRRRRGSTYSQLEFVRMIGRCGSGGSAGTRHTDTPRSLLPQSRSPSHSGVFENGLTELHPTSRYVRSGVQLGRNSSGQNKLGAGF